MKNYEIIGGLGQWLSLFFTLVGLIMMITSKAPEWHDFITSGALLLTIATKVRYYGGQILQRRKRNNLIKISELVDKERMEQANIKKSYQQEAQNG